MAPMGEKNLTVVPHWAARTVRGAAQASAALRGARLFRVGRKVVLYGLALVGFGTLLAGFTPLPNVIARALLVDPDLRRADAVVVLGAGLTSDCSLPNQSMRRTFHGVRILLDGYSSVIVFSSGVFRDNCPHSEAEAMKQFALLLGVPAPAILTEERSRSTHENAVESDRLLESLGASGVLLVTTPTHMRRASGAFRKQGLTVYPAPTDGVEHQARAVSGRIELLLRAGREIAGLLYYRTKGWL